MKITNEFTVHTPIDRAWQVLTDLTGIAPCMPGAQLTGVDGDVYQGKVKIKVGPVLSEFAGTARFTEKDDAAYRAVIDAKGRDARSAGNASALVTAVLAPAGDSTTVSVDTDLKISGKLAQFGSGMIKEVSAKLLAQFVANLEAKLATEPESSPTPGAAATPGQVATPGQDATPGLAAPSASGAGVVSPSSASDSVSIPADAAPPAEPATASPSAVATAPDTAIPPASASPVPTPAPPASSTPVIPAADAPASAPAAGSVPTPGAPIDADPAPEPVVAIADPAASPAAAFLADAQSPGPAATAPEGTPTSIRPAASDAASSGPVSAGPAAEAEPLDLLSLAGGSIYKRLIPLAAGVVVVGAVIAWLVARR
jgi:carbon monoxide dehydrogenase subunit G